MSAATPLSASAAVLKTIPIDQLEPNPWNRTVFDPLKMAGLVNSIRTKGIKEALIVREISPHKFQITSGHRRWLAAGEIGLKDLPCVVKVLSDEEVAEDNIVLNENRENISFFELGRMAETYMTEFNKTQKEVAELFGKDPSWVSHLLRFKDLPSKLKNMSALMFSWNQLQAMRSLPPTLQMQVANELESGALKQEKIEKRCNQMRFTAKAHRETTTQGAEDTPMDPTSDPLDQAWDGIREKTAGWSWSVDKESPQGWEFKIDLDGMYPKDVRKTLGQWFLAMAQALGSTEIEADTQQQLRYNSMSYDEMYKELPTLAEALEEAQAKSGSEGQPQVQPMTPELSDEIKAMVARQVAKGKVR